MQEAKEIMLSENKKMPLWKKVLIVGGIIICIPLAAVAFGVFGT
ncbi:MAG: hypothetical protein ACW99F_14445 [Candidatus Hodarchaeales archaeon]|jgi:hypothetical protein